MNAHKNIALHLQEDLLCTAITGWFDTGTVQMALLHQMGRAV